MKLIILGGNSVHNREWVLDIEKSLQNNFETKILQHKHWRTKESLINFNDEKENLLREIPNSDFAIFAKSAGAVLALKTLYGNKIKPKFMLFCGLPIHFAKQMNQDLEKYLKNNQNPTKIIQKTNDPAGSFGLIYDLTSKVNPKNQSS